MKTLYIGLFFVLMYGATSCSSPKTARMPASYSIAQFFETDVPLGAVLSPDNRFVATSSVKTGIYNIWEYPSQGGEPTQRTFSATSAIMPVSYMADSRSLIYSSDNEGDENYRLFLLSEADSVRDLTPWEGSYNEFKGWNSARDTLYFSSNRRDPMFFDVYTMDSATWTPSLLFENSQGFDGFEVSSDGQKIAMRKSISNVVSELYVWEKATGMTRKLSPDGAEAKFYPHFFSVDGGMLYVGTDMDGEFMHVDRFNLADGTHETVYSTNWDVNYSVRSRNGKYVAFQINEDAHLKTVIQDMASGRGVELPDFGSSNIIYARFSQDESAMVFTVAGSHTPDDLYYYNVADKKPVKLTRSLSPAIQQDDLVAASVVRFPSYDGVEISSLLYKPHQASSSNKVPAVLAVHGGPGGQGMALYFELFQYMVNQGYAVMDVNFRGSSGYGKTFFHLDDKKHGEADLDDLVEAKNYLATFDWIDTSKVAILGGSYGGFLTMAAMTSRPGVFGAGVNLFGVTNWLRTLESIPPYWEAFRKELYDEMGDPFTEDTVRLRRISPLYHADKITHPVMVLQGANDVRVIQAESDDMVAAMRANNVPVEYVLFPDEGHGFSKKENQIKGYGQVVEFLNRYLKGNQGG